MPYLPTIGQASLIYHRSLQTINRNLYCWRSVLLFRKNTWPDAAHIQGFKPQGDWNARKYWKYHLPAVQLTGNFSLDYAIFSQSLLPHQQVPINHNLEGTAELLVRSRVVSHHKLEEACGQRCSIALSWTMAFFQLVKRFSLHFWGWWEAILNFITLTHILSLNGSNKTTEIYIAWLKKGFIWPRHESSLPILSYPLIHKQLNTSNLHLIR